MKIESNKEKVNVNTKLNENLNKNSNFKIAAGILILILMVGGVGAADEGLVAYWSFDDGTANDGAGNNDGTIHGAKVVEGVFGKALEFDGVDDYVDCGNDANLQLQTMSIEFWFYSRDSTNSIITKGNSRNSNFRRDWDIAGGGVDLYFMVSDALSSNHHSSLFYVKKDAYPSLNKWHHLVAIWDGTTNTNGAKLYVDGTLVGQATSYRINKKGVSLRNP